MAADRQATMRGAALDYIALRRAHPGFQFGTALAMSRLPRFTVISGRIWPNIKDAAAAGALPVSSARAARLTGLVTRAGTLVECGVPVRLATERDFERFEVDGVGRVDPKDAPSDAAHIPLSVIKPTGPKARQRAKEHTYRELRAGGNDTFRERSAEQRRAAEADPTDWVS